MIFFYSLVFTLPIPDHPILAYHIGPFTVLKYLGMLCLLAAIVQMFRTESCPPFSKGLKYQWVLAYVLVAAVSCIVHDGSAAFSSSGFMFTVSTFSLFVVTTTMIQTPKHVRSAILVALGAAAWGSLYVIQQWRHFHNIYPGFRSSGLAGDPNYYAVTVVLWIPLMAFWLMAKRPRWEKWFCLACLPPMLLGFIFAASRGGFLGLSVALAFLIWHTRRRARTFALVALFMLPILLAPGQSAVSRLLHPDHSDEESSESRLELWQASKRSFIENPVFGVGMGHFNPWIIQNGQKVYLPFHVAHNTYVGVATDLGLAGLIPFIAVLVGAFRRAGGVARRTLVAKDTDRRLLHQAALGLQAGLIGYMVCAFFLSTQWQQVFWFSVFLSMCLPRIEASISDSADPETAELGPKVTQVPWKAAVSRSRSRSERTVPERAWKALRLQPSRVSKPSPGRYWPRPV